MAKKTVANLLKRRGYIQFSIPQGGLSRVPRSAFNGIFPTNMKSLDIEHFLCIFKGFFNTMIVP